MKILNGMVEMEPGSGRAGKGSNCGWTMRRTHVDQKTGSFFFAIIIQTFTSFLDLSWILILILINFSG